MPSSIIYVSLGRYMTLLYSILRETQNVHVVHARKLLLKKFTVMTLKIDLKKPFVRLLNS